jgi:hypothetical protein
LPDKWTPWTESWWTYLCLMPRHLICLDKGHVTVLYVTWWHGDLLFVVLLALIAGLITGFWVETNVFPKNKLKPGYSFFD